MRNLPCQIGNWMGNIVIRHSKNWNLGDGSVTALHAPGSLINSSQISVPIERKNGKFVKFVKFVKLLNLPLHLVIWRNFFKSGKILTEKGENFGKLLNACIRLCDLTSFQIKNSPEKKGEIREITEPAITLCDLTSFSNEQKEILHVTGETTPAGNFFSGSADLTQGLSVWTHIG